MLAVAQGRADIVPEQLRAEALLTDLRARCPEADLSNWPTLELARIGCNGKFPGNSFRDFLRVLGPAWRGLRCPLYTMRLPIWVKDDVRIVDWPCIAPHILAHELFSGSPSEDVFPPAGAAGGECARFWQAMRQAPWAKELPQVTDVQNQDRRIPYRIHGDAFRAYKRQRIVALTWRAAASQGDSWRTRLLFTLIPKRLMVHEQSGGLSQWNTLTWCLRHFARLLNILHIGTFPDNLPEGITCGAGCCSLRQQEQLCGKAVCGQWLFGFAGMGGDLEWFRDANLLMPFRRYYACKNVCCKCEAHTSSADRLYSDMGMAAGWRQRPIDTQRYLQLCSPPCRTPLAEIIGWSWELSNLEDVMHTVFLGIGADLVATTLQRLCQLGWYGEGPLASQLERCHTEAARFCSCPVLDFTPGLLGLTALDSEAFMATKAATVKALLGFVVQEVGLFEVQDGSREAAHLRAAAEGLHGFTKAMDEADWLMSADEVAASCCSLRRYQRAHEQLRRNAVGVIWKLRPKYHIVEHILEMMQRTSWNPRFWATWMDEDFMGKARDLCERVRAQGIAVCRNALLRYVLARAELCHRHRVSCGEL